MGATRNRVRRSVFALGSLTLTFLFGGCGPIHSSSVIIDATAELAAARTAQSEKLAPFEYVAAEAYLHKAREEQSYAEFEIAVRYAKKSLDCARAARIIAEASTNKSLGGASTGAIVGSPCRPGPERLIPRTDPRSEAAGLKAKSAPTQTAPASKKKKAAPAEPKDPPPAPPPAEEPALPEGDEGQSE